MHVLWLTLFSVLVAALVVATVADLRRRVVPDACVAAVALTGMAWALARGPGASFRALVGALVVGAAMVVAALVSARATGETGVGGGDVKLLAAAGTWAGPVGGLAVVALACAASVAVWALVCSVRWLFVKTMYPCGRGGAAPPRRPTADGMPMAPGIAVSVLVVVLVGMPPP